MDQVLRWIVDLFIIYHCRWKDREGRTLLQQPLIIGNIVGTFDGVAQDGVCGGGGTLMIDNRISYHFHIGLGVGTNTRT